MGIVTYYAKVSSRSELGNCAPDHGSILDGTVTLAANGGDRNRRAAIGNDMLDDVRATWTNFVDVKHFTTATL
jgi:hypothetical protein